MGHFPVNPGGQTTPNVNENRPAPRGAGLFDIPGQDSNLDVQDQNLLCYRYTTGERFAHRDGQ